MAFEGTQIRSTLDGGTVKDGARDDLQQAQVVGLSLVGLPQAPVSYEWLLTGRPEYSEAGGSGSSPWPLGTGPTAAFTVDSDSGVVHLDGTYIVQCTLNKDSPLETRFTVMLARNSPFTVPGFEDARPLRKLGMFESFEDTISIFGVMAGWSTMLNRWLDAIEGILAGGGGGGGSLLTTKGDLLTHSTVDVRLPVGNNGDVLTVDPAVPDGIKWAPPVAPAPGGITVATWTIGNATPRFYAIAPDGDDGAIGFSDTSPADAWLVRRRTFAGFLAILPTYGNDRSFVLLAGPGSYADDMSFNGAGFYRDVNIFGTTDGSYDATDRLLLGGTTALAGPNGDGSWTCGAGGTASTLNTAGGSPSLPAEGTASGINLWRLRWLPTTTTTALKNTCVTVYKNTTGSITFGEDAAGTNVAGDQFLLERPAAVFNSVLVRSLCHGTLTFGGIATTGTPTGTGSGWFFLGREMTVNVAFCEQRGAKFFVGQDLSQMGTLNTLTPLLTGATLTKPGGNRFEGTTSFSRVDNLNGVCSGSIQGGGGVTNAWSDIPNISWGRGCVMFCRLFLSHVGGPGWSDKNVVTITVGLGIIGGSLTGFRQLRIEGANSLAALSTNNCNLSIQNPNLVLAGGATFPAALNIFGDGVCMEIIGVTGSAPLTGIPAISTVGCRMCRFYYSGNTIAASTGRELALPGPGVTDSLNAVYGVHADLAKTNIIDFNGNEHVGSAGRLAASFSFAICDSAAGFTPGQAVYAEGTTKSFKLSKADAAATARVDGVAAMTCVLGDKTYVAAPDGVAYVNLDTATTGSLLYLSEVTAGALTFTAPPTVGTNQTVLVGRALDADGVKTAITALISREFLASGSTLPTTTKGDIIVHNGTTNVRQGVGTNGQVLTADSAQADGVKWATPSGAASPLNTKGDIFGYDTADQRIPVGSNGQVLTADSAQAAGVKWATPAGGSNGGAILCWATTDEVGNDRSEAVVAKSDVDFSSFPGPNITLDLSTWARNLSTAGISAQAQIRIRVGSSDPEAIDGAVAIGPLTIGSITTYGRVNASATITLPSGRQLIQLTVTGGTDGNGPFWGLVTAATVQLK